MKSIVLSMMLIGGALLSSYSSQAQGRRDHDNRGYRGNGYGHGGPRYEREYRRDDCRPGYGYGYGRRDVVYYEECRPAPVVYAAPCPPPPPPRRVYYPRGPRVVIAAGPVVVGF